MEALRIRRSNNESPTVLMLLPCAIALALLAFIGGRRAADVRRPDGVESEKKKRSARPGQAARTDSCVHG